MTAGGAGATFLDPTPSESQAGIDASVRSQPTVPLREHRARVRFALRTSLPCHRFGELGRVLAAPQEADRIARAMHAAAVLLDGVVVVILDVVEMDEERRGRVHDAAAELGVLVICQDEKREL